MINVIKQKYPIQAILKNNEKKFLHNYYESYLTTHGIFDFFSITNDVISIFKPNLPKVDINLGNNNGDVYSVFFEEIYNFLPVENKIVIDIGANIGDSSIYFAIKKAKHVIALEPLPLNYKIAKQNLQLNGLEEKIDLLLSGCSGTKGELIISTKQEGAGSSMDFSRSGIKVPLLSLEDIIKKYNIQSGVLKIDCEGCEYDAILSSSKKILTKFSHIQIEYHYGYKNLKEKLVKCGFDVKITQPHFIRNRQAGKNMFYGYIFAKRID
jgi:FkbM family methyltransferase